MLSRLLPRSSCLASYDLPCIRTIVTEVRPHASSSSSIVDDTPGPSITRKPFKTQSRRESIPHDPRKSARSGKIGYGSSIPENSITSAKQRYTGEQRSRNTPPRPRSGETKGNFVPIRTENPFVLGPQLVQLYKREGRAAALAEFAASKKEAKTVAVYNMIIKELLQDGHINAAYKLWMEMKKTALVPTPMSYTVFFSSIDPKHNVGKAREAVQTIWKQWQAYCEKATDPEDTLYELAQTDDYKITNIPTNAYISLSLRSPKSGDTDNPAAMLDDILEIKYFKPTKQALTSMFESINAGLQFSNRSSNGEKLANDSFQAAMKTWDFMIEKLTTTGLQLDGRTISAACIALRNLYAAVPKAFTQKKKLEILEHLESILGLDEPDSDWSKYAETIKPIAGIDSMAVYDAMVLASQFEGRYSRHVIEWFTRLLDARSKLLDARQCELYIKASPKTAIDTLLFMLRTPSEATRPTKHTYTAVLAARPFMDQLRILAHMTGRTDILMDGESTLLESTPVTTKDQQDQLPTRAIKKGYHTKHIAPDAKMMTILLQTALDLQDWRRIDRALQIIDTFGFVQPDQSDSNAEKGIYPARLRESIATACSKLLKNSAVPEERRKQIEDWNKTHNKGSDLQVRMVRRPHS